MSALFLSPLEELRLGPSLPCTFRAGTQDELLRFVEVEPDRWGDKWLRFVVSANAFLSPGVLCRYRHAAGRVGFESFQTSDGANTSDSNALAVARDMLNGAFVCDEPGGALTPADRLVKLPDEELLDRLRSFLWFGHFAKNDISTLDAGRSLAHLLTASKESPSPKSGAEMAAAIAEGLRCFGVLGLWHPVDSTNVALFATNTDQAIVLAMRCCLKEGVNFTVVPHQSDLPQW